MTRKPFFRAYDGWWYAQFPIVGKRVQKKLIQGKENEAEAYRLFYRLMSQESDTFPEPTILKVANVCDLFLKHSENHNDPDTFRWYQRYLQSFCSMYPRLGALDVKPFHVSRWLDANPKWTTGRRCAIIAVKRAYNWAEAEGLINSNPLKKVRKPPAKRRERILNLEERTSILAAIRDQEFKDFVYAMQETSARVPSLALVAFWA